jgi:hypothetical protein
VDIVVEIKGSVDPSTSGWVDSSPPGAKDGKAFDPSVDGGVARAVYVREIPAGIQKQLKGSDAPTKYFAFTARASGPSTRLNGTVHIFRSGNDMAFTFDCNTNREVYEIISGFDVVHGTLKSMCSQEAGK